MTPDAFAGMVASLQQSPTLAHTMSDRAELLRLAAEHLRGGPPAVQPVADAFEQYLAAGGDIERLLGLAVRRGKSNEAPFRARRRTARDDRLRLLAEALQGSHEARGARLAEMLQARHPDLLLIHQTTAPVPSSGRVIARILREPAGT